MMKRLLTWLGLVPADAPTLGRRRFARHRGGSAEAKIGGRIYDLYDWSLGGMALTTANDVSAQEGDEMDVLLKFRFANDTVTIPGRARVVRQTKRLLAVEFSDLAPESRKLFTRVLDNMHMEKFLQSQIA